MLIAKPSHRVKKVNLCEFERTAENLFVAKKTKLNYHFDWSSRSVCDFLETGKNINKRMNNVSEWLKRRFSFATNANSFYLPDDFRKTSLEKRLLELFWFSCIFPFDIEVKTIFESLLKCFLQKFTRCRLRLQSPRFCSEASKCHTSQL
jgi:hypothetical protein